MPSGSFVLAGVISICAPLVLLGLALTLYLLWLHGEHSEVKGGWMSWTHQPLWCFSIHSATLSFHNVRSMIVFHEHH
jgi:hypothetical protein